MKKAIFEGLVFIITLTVLVGAVVILSPKGGLN